MKICYMVLMLSDVTAFLFFIAQYALRESMIRAQGEIWLHYAPRCSSHNRKLRLRHCRRFNADENIKIGSYFNVE